MEATALRMSETRTVDKSDSDKDRKSGGNNAATSFVELLGNARMRFDGVNGLPAFLKARADKTRLPEQAAPRREEDPRAAPAQNAEKPEPRAKDKADDRSAVAEKPEASERPKADAKDKPKAKDKTETKADGQNKTDSSADAAVPAGDACDCAQDAQPAQAEGGDAAPRAAAEAAPAETDASALVAAQMTQMEILVAPVAAQQAADVTADDMLATPDAVAAVMTADAKAVSLTVETIAPQTSDVDANLEADAAPVDLLADAAMPASDFDDLLMVATAAAKPQTTVAANSVAQQQAAELAQLAGPDMAVKVETIEVAAQPTLPQTARALTAEAALAAAETPETVVMDAPILDDAGAQTQQQTNSGNQPNANAQGLAQAASRLVANGALENQIANPNGKAMDAPSFAAALNQAQAQVAADGDEGSQAAMNRVGGTEATNPSAGTAQNANSAAQQAHAARAMQPARPAVLPQQVTNQISVQIEKAVKDGMDRINIQLRPESLGRVDVRLELANDGRVQATITADRPETLEMLQKDARGLERSLADAGLKTDTSSLSFSLRQGENQQAQGDGRTRRQGSGRNGGGEKEMESASETSAPTQRARVADGRVDIRV